MQYLLNVVYLKKQFSKSGYWLSIWYGLFTKALEKPYMRHYKPQILDPKIEEFLCFVNKLSVILTALQYKLQ